MEVKLLNIAKQYSEGFIALFYPQFCVICNKELNGRQEHFCFLCEQDLHYTYFEKYTESSIADELFWGRLKIENVYSLLYYEKRNSTQKILHHIKYHEGKELGHFMGKQIGKKLKLSKKLSSIEALIPIPLHSKKQFLRGYNQSMVIAQGIHEELGIPIVNALYRKTNDESQTKKSKEERYENVKGRFAARPGLLDDYKHVMLVDDVLTTGSTLEFAARAVFDSSENIKLSIGTIAMAHD